MKSTEPKRILFYTLTPRQFRATLAGYLFEICQEWPTILVSEKLDKESENSFKNKKFFFALSQNS